MVPEDRVRTVKTLTCLLSSSCVPGYVGLQPTNASLKQSALMKWANALIKTQAKYVEEIIKLLENTQTCDPFPYSKCSSKRI